MRSISTSIWMLSVLGLSLTVITGYSVQPQNVLVSGIVPGIVPGIIPGIGSSTPADVTRPEIVTQSSGFEVPDGIGLPNRREPGGTR